MQFTQSARNRTRRRTFRPFVERLEGRELLANSSYVFPAWDGNLLYQPDGEADRIPDFANVGYGSGIYALPGTPGGVTVPTRVTLDPTAGDQTARIQAAINQVQQMPLDANGFRGAVRLNAGEYPISGQLRITASGVVLRGIGWGMDNGTRLRATGTSQRSLIQVAGSGSRQRVGAVRNIVDKVVPVGARSFRLDNVSGLAIGDTVRVTRPSTANWIQDIYMDRLAMPWQPGSKNLFWDRVITRIEGNWVTLDAPLTNSLEQRYGGGTLYEYTWPGRLENVGIENMLGRSDYGSSTDENHSWRFIEMDSVQNAWVRHVRGFSFAYAVVDLKDNAKWVTVQDVHMIDPVSVITGGRRYSFNVDGELNLVRDSSARRGRHDFVNGAQTAGPNVFVDSRADLAYSDTGPHHRWSAGTLFDNLTVSGHQINVQNRGNSGTGHGWAGANMVIWNSTASGGYIVQNPPTAQNWLIGSTGPIRTGSGYVGPRPTPTTPDSHGVRVEPRSLYHAQLQERMTWFADRREYWAGDIDRFSLGDVDDYQYVDPDWYATVQAATAQPLDEFDHVRSNHWVPFTFTFPLAEGEYIVGASLSVGLRAVGNSALNDRIYIDDLAISASFEDLGWAPIPTTGTAGRVLDLSGLLDYLQDGTLNVAIQDDTSVDWAVLNGQVAYFGAAPGGGAPSGKGAPLGGPADAWIPMDGLAIQYLVGEHTAANPRRLQTGG